MEVFSDCASKNYITTNKEVSLQVSDFTDEFLRHLMLVLCTFGVDFDQNDFVLSKQLSNLFDVTEIYLEQGCHKNYPINILVKDGKLYLKIDNMDYIALKKLHKSIDKDIANRDNRHYLYIHTVS